MNFMFYNERQKKLIEILIQKKTVSIRELSEKNYISVSTLRRDLIYLEQMGIVKRYHGGVSLVSGTTMEYSSSFREMENRKQKEYICAIAENFLSGGMCLFLDSSSTVLGMCDLISRYPNMTVLTNGLKTGLKLCDSENVVTYVSGGTLKKHSSTLLGSLSKNFFEEFKADLSILSCRGIDKDGIYEADKEQALIKQSMIQNSKQIILLCDSSKFNRSYFCKLCSYTDIDVIITDRRPEILYENINCEFLF